MPDCTPSSLEARKSGGLQDYRTGRANTKTANLALQPTRKTKSRSNALPLSEISTAAVAAAATPFKTRRGAASDIGPFRFTLTLTSCGDFKKRRSAS
ncbi:hypothetical protein MRX96_022956 [Rhipicephalus microplus]